MATKDAVELPTPVSAKQGTSKRLMVILVVGLALLAIVFVGRTVMAGGGKTSAPPVPAAGSTATGPAAGAPAPAPGAAAAAKPTQAGPAPNTTRDPFKPLR